MRCILCLLLLPSLATGCARFSPWKDPVELESDASAFEKSSGLLGGGESKRSLRRTMRTAVGKGPSKDAARKLFAEAEQHYRTASRQQGAERKRSFLAAAGKYWEASQRWPDSALEEDAVFMSADSLFFADHYEDANERFEELLKRYPNSQHLDMAEARRFAIARYWEQRATADGEPFYYMNFTQEDRPFRDVKGHALRVYDKIRIDDPTGRLADDATMAAANLHFEQGRYVLADEYYTDLRRTFPNSEHQFMAHFLGLRAKLAAYQGVDYSGTVLNQAEELIQAMRAQFPNESREKSEYLARAEAEVGYLLAERDWSTGQYYDRRSEFGAARFHYARVLQQYGSTPFAEKARQRLENIRGLPEAPEQKMEWLVDLFPQETEPKLRMIADGQDPTAIARRTEDDSRAR